MNEFEGNVSEQEIWDLLNQAQENIDDGVSACRGQSYEEGIVAALEWLAARGGRPLEAAND